MSAYVRRVIRNAPQATRPDGAKAPRQFSADRTCCYPDCRVRLSRYNPGEFCGIHAPLDLRIPANWADWR
ncbi:MAG TPA: hypothetical protein VF029_05295 [Actinomycetota bacterium]